LRITSTQKARTSFIYSETVCTVASKKNWSSKSYFDANGKCSTVKRS
jgi:hypothetical protein